MTFASADPEINVLKSFIDSYCKYAYTPTSALACPAEWLNARFFEHVAAG
jgi:hypothetical protein